VELDDDHSCWEWDPPHAHRWTVGNPNVFRKALQRIHEVDVEDEGGEPFGRVARRAERQAASSPSQSNAENDAERIQYER
jgi:hypothetical protein